MASQSPRGWPSQSRLSSGFDGIGFSTSRVRLPRRLEVVLTRLLRPTLMPLDEAIEMSDEVMPDCSESAGPPIPIPEPPLPVASPSLEAGPILRLSDRTKGLDAGVVPARLTGGFFTGRRTGSVAGRSGAGLLVCQVASVLAISPAS